MKTLRTILVLSACVIFCGTVSAQSAPPTITFNVPLQLTDLHQDVESVYVVATVWDNPGRNHACATGHVDIPCPANGNINQTVTVVAEQVPGQDITKAMNYSVVFDIIANGQRKTPGQDASFPIEFRAKEGTPFTQIVRDDVSW
jgi:hypothetical protein